MKNTATKISVLILSAALVLGHAREARANPNMNLGGLALMHGLMKGGLAVISAGVPDFTMRVHHAGDVDYGLSWQLPIFFDRDYRHGMQLSLAHYPGEDAYTLLRAGYLLRVLPWHDWSLPLSAFVEGGVFAGFRGEGVGPRAAVRVHVGRLVGLFVSAAYEYNAAAPSSEDASKWGVFEAQVGFEFLL